MTQTKEDVYDEQIAPLMAKIMEICEKHNIAVLTSFHIPSRLGENMFIASANSDEHGEFPEHMDLIYKILTSSIDMGQVVKSKTMSH